MPRRDVRQMLAAQKEKRRKEREREKELMSKVRDLDKKERHDRRVLLGTMLDALVEEGEAVAVRLATKHLPAYLRAHQHRLFEGHLRLGEAVDGARSEVQEVADEPAADAGTPEAWERRAAE